jgi:serine/threonine protein kinase
MHRDFKLANLLLHDRVCKIADLGFAKQMMEQELSATILGTYITMAPEVLEKRPYGINADIWSLGVVFYQMLTGKYPYKGMTGSDLLKNIKTKQNDLSNLRISSLAKNFIQGCLT